MIDALYEEQSALARREAQRWHPDRLRPLYAEFFRNVRLQPGTPFVARTARAHRRTGPPHAGPLADGSGRPGSPGRSAALSPAGRGRRRMHRTSAHGGDRRGAIPISFVVCVSDDAILKANLLASPGLVGPDSPHEVILIHKAPSAARWAEHGPGTGPARMGCLRAPGRSSARPAGTVASPSSSARPSGGSGRSGSRASTASARPSDCNRRDHTLGAQRVGWVVDRGRTLREGPELPARVATLDELLLVVRRDTPLRFDPALGFHLYGADLCLQAAERGLAVVCLGALCHHNSRSIGLPKAFYPSAEVFARKWAHRLPVATSCVVIDRQGGVCLLGNTPFRRGGPPPMSSETAFPTCLPAPAVARNSRFPI